MHKYTEYIYAYIKLTRALRIALKLWWVWSSWLCWDPFVVCLPGVASVWLCSTCVLFILTCGSLSSLLPPAKFSFLPVSDSQTDLVLSHFLFLQYLFFFFSILEVVASEISNHFDNFPFVIDFIWNRPLDLTSSGKYTFIFLILNWEMVYSSGLLVSLLQLVELLIISNLFIALASVA